MIVDYRAHFRHLTGKQGLGCTVAPPKLRVFQGYWGTK